MSGVPAAEIERIALELATAEGGVAYGRVGVSTHEFGSVCQWAVNLLNIVTGNLDRVGGAMFTSPAIDVVGTGLIGRGHHNAWQSRVRGLPETAGELPVSALREEITTPGKGQIRAMLTRRRQPGAVHARRRPARRGARRPGLHGGRRHLRQRDDPARRRDPAAGGRAGARPLRPDLPDCSAVRNTARFTPAVFEKDAGARHDWQIYRDVALATIAKLDKKPALKARAIMRARLSLSPTRLIALLLARARNGVTLKKLRANPSGLDLGPLQPGLLPERLQTRDHRMVLAPPLVLADLERLTAVEAPDEGELLLIGRRHKQDCNSWMHNTERLTRGKARHQLLMHPADLAQRVARRRRRRHGHVPRRQGARSRSPRPTT